MWLMLFKLSKRAQAIHLIVTRELRLRKYASTVN